MEIADNDRIMPKVEVQWSTGLSDTTLWREVKAGRFPPPVRISRQKVGWLESAVRSWKQERVREAYRPEPEAA